MFGKTTDNTVWNLKEHPNLAAMGQCTLVDSFAPDNVL